VVLRVNEVRDLGDTSRFDFYEHMKIYCAAPPDSLRVNEKYIPQYWVPNCCGVVTTTNHKTDGIFLPADDRRTFVAWSDLEANDFKQVYWDKLWNFYVGEGGYGHVAAYLAQKDISKFNPNAPPAKTAAFWAIVDANRAPEDAELADVLDRMGKPRAVTLDQIKGATKGGVNEFRLWINDRRNRRAIPHRLEKCGYTAVRNDAASDGLWKIGGRRQVVYAQSALPTTLQHKAVRALVDEG
jgi:hypothetical protein